MEIQIESIIDGRNKIPSQLVASLKGRCKKFFECDAFVASLALDPRFTWCAQHEIFNYELRDRAVVILF